MVATISNFANGCPANSRLLVPFINNGYKDFAKLCNASNTLDRLVVDQGMYQSYISKSHDNQTLAEVSGRMVLDNYPEAPYLSVDKTQLRKCTLPPKKYVTFQYTGVSKRCNYTSTMIDSILRRWYPNYAYINIGGRESMGLATVAYMIEHAEFHVGIDSGLTHLAYCVKDPKDVHVYIPTDRQTGVAKRWIEKGYDVRLI
jgi:hypothetical protein